MNANDAMPGGPAGVPLSSSSSASPEETLLMRGAIEPPATPGTLGKLGRFDIIRMLVEKRISGAAFLDEFVEFTRMVAGKLDFGIYSMCVDRLFGSETIPMPVKTFLLKEVLRFPPMIRKELLTNLLSSVSAPGELVRFARGDRSQECSLPYGRTLRGRAV